MIEFLKQSTFEVNEIVQISWSVLYKNFKNIIAMCICIFVLSTLSSFLSDDIEKGFRVSNIIFLFFFTVTIFGFQLALWKFLLHAVAHESEDHETFAHKFVYFLKHNLLKIIIIIFILVAFFISMLVLEIVFDLNGLYMSIATLLIGFSFVVFRLWNQINPFFRIVKQFWPSSAELMKFLAGVLVITVIWLILFLLPAILTIPLVYTGIDTNTLLYIVIRIAAMLGLIAVIRLSFFQYFILDQGFPLFKALRLSMAVTRGNFVKLMLLVGTVLLSFYLVTYLQTLGHYLLSLLGNIFFTFVMIPLFSVGTAVAYRQMMNEYEGDSDPDIIHNII